jgi:hypothetical protein
VLTPSDLISRDAPSDQDAQEKRISSLHAPPRGMLRLLAACAAVLLRTSRDAARRHQSDESLVKSRLSIKTTIVVAVVISVHDWIPQVYSETPRK